MIELFTDIESISILVDWLHYAQRRHRPASFGSRHISFSIIQYTICQYTFKKKAIPYKQKVAENPSIAFFINNERVDSLLTIARSLSLATDSAH